MTPDDRDSIVVRLFPVGDGPPSAVRLRRGLKVLLRTCGLRAEWTRADAPTPTPGKADIRRRRTASNRVP